MGREQVADCPTAISELWKNAFDAYATEVALDLFDEKSPVAVVSDNGHGMNLDEFQDRWLVIGTESKATADKVPMADRKGLQERVKQGQKGIGRLSCANLGPILLLISKRSNQKFVLSLIDWRMFENPYLNLADIFFPTVEVSNLKHGFDRLPSMIEELIQNIEPDQAIAANEFDLEKQENVRRIAKAWSDFDNLPERAGGVTSQSIVKSIRELNFSLDHLSGWGVAQGISGSGSALIVSNVNYDLRVQLLNEPFKQTEARTRRNFRETLASVNGGVKPCHWGGAKVGHLVRRLGA